MNLNPFVSDIYIESSELRNTESHYQERCFILSMTVEEITGLMQQNADKDIIKKQIMLALRYYNDLKGRKTWFRETEPELYEFIKIFLKNKHKLEGII